jgi:HEAT repeat protein
VRKLTQDRNKDVNIYAASMLLAAGEKEYINIVRQGLTSTDKILRGACVNVLSQLADEASYKSLKYISKKDEDETIRVTAFKGCLLIESNMREKEKTGKTAR